MSDARERHLRGGRDGVARAPDAPAAPVGPDREGCDSPVGRDELGELRELVSLLRKLPDPEPPEGLTERVMERVAEIEARPWYGAFRSEIAPVLGSALAAGLAGLLFFAALQRSPIQSIAFFGPGGDASLGRIDSTAVVRGGPSPRTRRPSVVSLSPAAVSGTEIVFFAAEGPVLAVPGAEPVPAMRSNPIDRGLDRQLNLMLLDPNAFFQRLESVLDRDRFVARLASRAALRGDATQVALRLRSSPHHLARPTSDRFLRASLVEYVSGSPRD